MTDFDQIMEDVLTDHADVWEALAKGSTAIEREVAFVLRSIVAEIEGPHPANRDSVREVLRWCLDVLGVEPSTTPYKVCVPYDSDQGLTDSSTRTPENGWLGVSGVTLTNLDLSKPHAYQGPERFA